MLPCVCSQMTSKCGKNKKVAHEVQPSVWLMFLPLMFFIPYSYHIVAGGYISTSLEMIGSKAKIH